MEGVKEWFLRNKEKQNFFVSLCDMMFEGDDSSYLLFRLRLFNLQTLFRFLIHATFFFLMFNHLSSRTLSTIIFYMAFKTFISAAWWGGLETLRTEVRYLFKAKEEIKINQLIGFWITISLILSFLFLAISVWFLYQGYSLKPILGGEKYKALFISVIFFTLALQIPIRTYHSGIYAISRVIRPGYSMILGNLAGLLILALLWKRLHELSIPIAFFVSSIISSLLTYSYTRFMYSLYNFSPKKLRLPQFFYYLKKGSWIHTFLAAVSNIFIQVDSLLILAFYYASWNNKKLLPMLFVIFLIAPLIRATSDWAKLFYFDRKRLSNEYLFHFISTYNKYINQAAAYIGLFFWLLSVVAVLVLISPKMAGFTALLFPLFVLRAKITDKQVKAFSSFHYGDIILSGLFLVAGTIFAYVYPLDFILKGIFLLFISLYVVAFLRKYHLPAYHKFNTRNFLINLYQFLSILKKDNGFFEVYEVKLSKGITTAQLFGLMGKISDLIYPENGRICLVNDRTFLFSKTHLPLCPPLHPTMIAAMGGGEITHFNCNIVKDSNLDCPVLAPYIKRLSKEAASPPLSFDAIKQTFLEWFPDGIFYHPKRFLGPNAQPISKEEIRNLPYYVNLYLINRKPRNDPNIDVSAFFIDETIKIIFVIPKSDDFERQEKVHAWHTFIHSQSISNINLFFNNTL